MQTYARLCAGLQALVSETPHVICAPPRYIRKHPVDHMARSSLTPQNFRSALLAAYFSWHVALLIRLCLNGTELIHSLIIRATIRARTFLLGWGRCGRANPFSYHSCDHTCEDLPSRVEQTVSMNANSLVLTTSLYPRAKSCNFKVYYHADIYIFHLRSTLSFVALVNANGIDPPESLLHAPQIVERIIPNPPH